MGPKIDQKESKKSAMKNTGSTNVLMDSDKTSNMDNISKSVKKQLQDSEKRTAKKLLNVFDKVDEKLDDNFNAMNDKFLSQFKINSKLCLAMCKRIELTLKNVEIS